MVDTSAASLLSFLVARIVAMAGSIEKSKIELKYARNFFEPRQQRQRVSSKRSAPQFMSTDGGAAASVVLQHKSLLGCVFDILGALAFSRLATVCRTWANVGKSDKLWQCVNLSECDAVDIFN